MFYKHGWSHTPEHRAWKSLRQRCNCKAGPDYAKYGARGIRVCDRWQSFENFIADMGARPTPAHSLDRIDNDGPYSPENCRWATDKQQSRNRRSNQIVEYRGERRTLIEWCELLSLPYGPVKERLRAGYTGDYLFRPVKKKLLGKTAAQ